MGVAGDISETQGVASSHIVVEYVHQVGSQWPQVATAEDAISRPDIGAKGNFRIVRAADMREPILAASRILKAKVGPACGCARAHSYGQIARIHAAVEDNVI